MTWTLLAKRLVQNQSLSWGKIFVVFYRKSIFLDLVLLLYYSPFVCDIHMVESNANNVDIDRTNPWIAVQSFTDPFREILIFNHFDNHQGQHLCFRKKEKTNLKTN